MKKNILILLVINFACFNVNAQIYFSEGFEEQGIPAGWSVESNATDGGFKIGSASQLSSDFFIIDENGTGNIAATNDDLCNCNKRNEYLITPMIELESGEKAFLHFNSYFLDNNYQGAQEHASVEISIAGSNWQILEDIHGHGSWDRHIVDLSDFAGIGEFQIGFRYTDNGGWLYGFGIDEVEISSPPAREVALLEVTKQRIGTVNSDIPIKGIIQNRGHETINQLRVKYSVSNGEEKEQTFSDLNLYALQFYNFEFGESLLIDQEGEYIIDIEILEVNGLDDYDSSDNKLSFEIELFENKTRPDKIVDFLVAEPIIEVEQVASQFLDKPNDLEFFPVYGKDELWIVNERNEEDGGSTLTIQDASKGATDYLFRVDGNAWHFMSLPTGIAFSDDNFNFATSPGVQDANHNGGTFTGPTLWSSDPIIYAQPSGGNGSHLDMLHGSPKSMGIAHEKDNVFWVYDNWNKDIVRYDFVEDHGPGNDDHSDAIVRRFKNIGITADGDIPNHMAFDSDRKWLYFSDNGNRRIIRLDITSGTGQTFLPEINEPLAEHSSITGFNYEEIISSGFETPCGLEVFGNYLLVGDYVSGDIIIYDIESQFKELGRITTILPGLSGITIGPNGNIWFTNSLQNTVSCVKPQEVSSVYNPQAFDLKVFPNPSNGEMQIKSDETIELVSVFSADGRLLNAVMPPTRNSRLNLNIKETGVYLLRVETEGGKIQNKRVVISD